MQALTLSHSSRTTMPLALRRPAGARLMILAASSGLLLDSSSFAPANHMAGSAGISLRALFKMRRACASGERA